MIPLINPDWSLDTDPTCREDGPRPIASVICNRCGGLWSGHVNRMAERLERAHPEMFYTDWQHGEQRFTDAYDPSVAGVTFEDCKP